jgi:hypothetical protein
MAPTTGLSATSSTRPLSNARNRAASNNRLVPKSQTRRRNRNDEFEIDVGRGSRNAPELLDENGDTGPSAQAQCPFRSTADRQTTTHMINGDMPSK